MRPHVGRPEPRNGSRLPEGLGTAAAIAGASRSRASNLSMSASSFLNVLLDNNLFTYMLGDGTVPSTGVVCEVDMPGA